MELWFQEVLTLIPGGTPFVLAVCAVAFLEALVGVGLLLPGSLLTVFSGWLALQGKAPIGAVMLAAGCGALLGDLLSFWCGSRFGVQLWRGRLLARRRDLLVLTELLFFEHGGKSVFIGRFLGPVRGLIPFVAGAARMAPRPFFVYSLVSGLLWGISYPGLGYLGGHSWQSAETLISRLGLLLLLGLVAGLVVFWLRRRFLPKR